MAAKFAFACCMFGAPAVVHASAFGIAGGSGGAGDRCWDDPTCGCY
jgi:hypothetical protein